MKIILSGVSKGETGENLPPTSGTYESGAVSMVAVETAQRPTVLALLATGRMAPDAGVVSIDGEEDAARLRSVTAIVDAPDVSEPVGDLKVSAVVQEELMFAGQPSNRRATAEALGDLGVADFAGWEIQNIPTVVRLRMLTELAASRPDVEALVLTAPDRRGSDPFEWWKVATDLASRGYAVLVIASPASTALLAEVSASFESDRVAEIERMAEIERLAEAERLAETERHAETERIAEEKDPS